MPVRGVEDITKGKLISDPGNLEAFTEEIARSGNALPNRINADPEGVEQGLAKLVLTLIELLRQLMERQALRRIEAGSLSDEEIDRLGETFMKLDIRMEELIQIFGLEDEDLNIDLGPLGNLL